MSNRFDLRRSRLAGAVLATAFVFAAVPIAAQASAVNLGTASPFVVLAGSTATNEGASVLNGDLGVSPGSSLTGFDEAVVNGTTHDGDEVAADAQSDLGNAYDVAAGQEVPPGNDLTGQDLGNLELTAGAYGFSSSAQLTGELTLNAQGNPDAQFVFVVGSTLTTASASSVVLVNGASPCNVYWKIGSSATLGSTTSFEGNLMSQTSISVDEGATVVGRLLAREGAVTLIGDTLTALDCSTGSPPITTPTPTPTPTPTSSAPAGSTATATGSTTSSSTGTKGGGRDKAKSNKSNTGSGTATIHRGKTTNAGTPATVHGREIKSVVFTDNGKRIPNTSKKQTNVPDTPGTHVVVAHVKFKGSTKPQTATVTIRVPFPVLHPRHGPSQFTG